MLTGIKSLSIRVKSLGDTLTDAPVIHGGMAFVSYVKKEKKKKVAPTELARI